MTRRTFVSPVPCPGPVAAAFLILAALSASAEDWPYFRGPNQSGSTTEDGWQTWFPDSGPRIAWNRNVGIGCSSVVVSGDRALTMGNRDDKDVVSCLNVDDGKVIWEFEYDNPFEKRMHDGGSASTPTIDGDFVYTLSYNGHVHCLKLSDGRPVWKRNLVRHFEGELPRWKYAGSPFIAGDLVILDAGGEGNSVLALNKHTGEKVWGSGSDASTYASTVAFSQDGRDAIVLFRAEAIVAYDRAIGDELWRIPWKSKYDVNASTPTVIGNEFYFSSGYGTGRTAKYRLGANGPEQVWLNEELKTKMSSCVVHNGAVFGITEVKARLLCLDQDSGEIQWEARDFTQYGSLIVAGDHIIALTEKGELVFVEANPRAFRELARAQVVEGKCWVTPSMANGRIYCKNNVGDLVVVDVRPDS